MKYSQYLLMVFSEPGPWAMLQYKASNPLAGCAWLIEPLPVHNWGFALQGYTGRKSRLNMVRASSKNM